MLVLHKLLAKLGHQTETYKIERFKAEHPRHIVMNTWVNDTMGNSHYTERYWKEYRVSAITGEAVLFAPGKRQAYIAARGKVELDLQLEGYTKSSKSSSRYAIAEDFLQYHVTFDAVYGGSYRVRFNEDKRELEIIYEHGDKHRIYTFS